MSTEIYLKQEKDGKPMVRKRSAVKKLEPSGRAGSGIVPTGEHAEDIKKVAGGIKKEREAFLKGNAAWRIAQCTRSR